MQDTGVQRAEGAECRGAEGAGLMSAGGKRVQGVQRHRGPGVPGYHWLTLATIDLVGDNRDFET